MEGGAREEIRENGVGRDKRMCRKVLVTELSHDLENRPEEEQLNSRRIKLCDRLLWCGNRAVRGGIPQIYADPRGVKLIRLVVSLANKLPGTGPLH